MIIIVLQMNLTNSARFSLSASKWFTATTLLEEHQSSSMVKIIVLISFTPMVLSNSFALKSNSKQEKDTIIKSHGSP